MKKRPGVLLYFDIRNGMKRLSTSDKGRLFDAILDYAENGVVPDFEGGLGVAWDFIVQKLDKDAETYAAKSVANQYGPYVREQEKRGLPTITREEWCALSDARTKTFDVVRHRMISIDIQLQPTYIFNPSTPTTVFPIRRKTRRVICRRNI